MGCAVTARGLERLFSDCFSLHFNTKLVGGAPEPFYTPASAGSLPAFIIGKILSVVPCTKLPTGALREKPAANRMILGIGIIRKVAVFSSRRRFFR